MRKAFFLKDLNMMKIMIHMPNMEGGYSEEIISSGELALLSMKNKIQGSG